MTAHIIVSTAQSAADQTLSLYAQTFAASLGTSHIHIAGPSALSVAIQNTLGLHPGRPFYFFGHGSKQPPTPGLVDHAGAVALHANNAQLLHGRSVTMTCCHGDHLGPHLAVPNTKTVGFRGPLRVINLTLPKHVQDAEQAFLAAPLSFARGEPPHLAARAARRAFRGLARQMYARNGAWDRLLATQMSLNAVAVHHW